MSIIILIEASMITPPIRTLIEIITTIFILLVSLFAPFALYAFISIDSSFDNEEAEMRSGAFCSSVKIGELPQDVLTRALHYGADKKLTRLINMKKGIVRIHAEFTGSFLYRETYVCSINAHPKVTDFKLTYTR